MKEMYQNLIDDEIKTVLSSRKLPLYDMMFYHFGFDQEDVSIPITHPHGTAFLMAVDALGGNSEQCLPVAVSIELVNAFCDVHDDIESGRPKRGQKDTLWWVWGPAQAINAGDGMHALARLSMLELPSKGFSAEQSYLAIRILDKATLKSCEGRFSELQMQEQVEVPPGSYVKAVRERVGALYGASFEVAGLLCGIEGDKLKMLDECGTSLGEAIQISRDIRQFWGDDSEDNLDFLNKRKSFPVVAAMEVAGPREKRLIGEVYFKRVLESSDFKKIRAVVEELGGKEFSDSQKSSAQANSVRLIEKIFEESKTKVHLMKYVSGLIG